MKNILHNEDIQKLIEILQGALSERSLKIKAVKLRQGWEFHLFDGDSRMVWEQASDDLELSKVWSMLSKLISNEGYESLDQNSPR